MNILISILKIIGIVVGIYWIGGVILILYYEIFNPNADLYTDYRSGRGFTKTKK